MNDIIKIGLTGVMVASIGLEIAKAGCVNIVKMFNGINHIAENICENVGYELDLIDVDENLVYEVFDYEK